MGQGPRAMNMAYLVVALDQHWTLFSTQQSPGSNLPFPVRHMTLSFYFDRILDGSAGDLALFVSIAGLELTSSLWASQMDLCFKENDVRASNHASRLHC